MRRMRVVIFWCDIIMMQRYRVKFVVLASSPVSPQAFPEPKRRMMNLLLKRLTIGSIGMIMAWLVSTSHGQDAISGPRCDPSFVRWTSSLKPTEQRFQPVDPKALNERKNLREKREPISGVFTRLNTIRHLYMHADDNAQVLEFQREWNDPRRRVENDSGDAKGSGPLYLENRTRIR